MNKLLVLLLLLPFVSAYSAPEYDAVDLVLDVGYSAPTNLAVDLVLGDVGSGDACTPPAVNNNWTVSMSDNCSLAGFDLGTGILNFTGVGWANCTGSVNVSDLGAPPVNSTLWIGNASCHILIG